MVLKKSLITKSFLLALVPLLFFVSLLHAKTTGPTQSAGPILTACTNNTAEIIGTAFRDYNSNGTEDTREPGYEGITVNLYDDTNVAIATTTTDAAGEYLFNGLTAGTTYRVEFEFANPTTTDRGFWHGSSNTSVLFVQPGTCTADTSINDPSDYSMPNPSIGIACYLQADDVTAASWLNETAIVEVPYRSGTTEVTNLTTMGNEIENEDYMNQIASFGEVGATYGLVYDQTADTYYASAFTRRHVPFGPSGTGAIYKIDSTGTVTTFADLNALVAGTPAGADGHLPNGNDYTDDDIWDDVGKTSFGDMAIADDFSSLFTVTLTDSDRSLYKINIPAGGAAPGAGDVTAYTLPSPAGCPNHASTGGGELNRNLRPGALDVINNTLYVGLTCTGEDDGAGGAGAVADMESYVYEFDIDAGTFGGAPVLTIPLDYARTPANDTGGAGVPGAFNVWTATPTYNGDSGNASYPMPLLMDINFSDDGCMVLGIMDRFGMLGGGNHNPPSSYNGNSAGDVLKACNLAGTWTLENNANDGVSAATSGAGNGAGPGGGEFFYEEAFDIPGNSYHTEIANGGLTIVRGLGEVLLGAYDPVPRPATLASNGANSFDSGGVIWLDTVTGNRTRSYVLFNRLDYGGNGGPGLDKSSATGAADIGDRSSSFRNR